jgi:hypothetical protein
MATSISIAGQAGSRTTRPRLGLALAIIATAQLMIVLDSTIVNVALPRIQVALGFSGSGTRMGRQRLRAHARRVAAGRRARR